MRKVFIFTSVIAILVLCALFATVWKVSRPQPAFAHDVSANFLVYWKIGQTEYQQGTTNDISAGTYSFQVIIKRSGFDVTSDFKIAHTFVYQSGATSTTTIDSANLGSYGELGTLDFTNASCKPAIIAYKTDASGEYVQASVEFH